uniref:DoxX family membrane protein n=1 Tax=Syphacia muris TaxID=451379 RepID=A0A0N5AD33_9BILA
MFAGGFGRDRESAEELRKAAALVAKQDLTAFLLFGVAIEIGKTSYLTLLLMVASTSENHRRYWFNGVA